MRYRRLSVLVAASFSIPLIGGCGATTTPPPSPMEGALELTSAAFAEGEAIPEKYTCDGQDISPPLSWSDPPEGTKSFALIVDDPDAPLGTWVHWVLFNIPADRRSLPEDVPAEETLSDGALHGQNGWKRLAYGGPCPPSGSTHQYVFKLYALDTILDAEAGAKKNRILKAMEGHILAETRLTATYSRQ